MFDHDEIKSKLYDGVCKVAFTKVNGETRIMHCTLKENLIPEQISVEELTNTRKGSPNVIAAWDVEKQDWRSFRIDSITSFDTEFNL
jgi:hypothetical protein